jgi:hypothetical protein
LSQDGEVNFGGFIVDGIGPVRAPVERRGEDTCVWVIVEGNPGEQEALRTGVDCATVSCGNRQRYWEKKVQ